MTDKRKRKVTEENKKDGIKNLGYSDVARAGGGKTNVLAPEYECEAPTEASNDLDDSSSDAVESDSIESSDDSSLEEAGENESNVDRKMPTIASTRTRNARIIEDFDVKELFNKHVFHNNKIWDIVKMSHAMRDTIRFTEDEAGIAIE